MFIVYSKEKIAKELFTVNLTHIEVNELMGGNLFLDHPDINQEDCVVINRENRFQYPTWNGSDIVEMTIEQRILWLNHTYLLNDGQYVEKDTIKTIEKPKDMLIPVWNKETNEWVETVTKEYLIELRASKIIEYSKLEEDKKIIEGSKFASEDEILDITKKMESLEGEINNLKTKIDVM